ncbi:MAG: hypothetical protein O7G84_00960 [Gammaproteobacteria bacterium]|nr:hypothetical protein [Gammaproteobacteria bacterium]
MNDGNVKEQCGSHTCVQALGHPGEHTNELGGHWGEPKCGLRGCDNHPAPREAAILCMRCEADVAKSLQGTIPIPSKIVGDFVEGERIKPLCTASAAGHPKAVCSLYDPHPGNHRSAGGLEWCPPRHLAGSKPHPMHGPGHTLACYQEQDTPICGCSSWMTPTVVCGKDRGHDDGVHGRRHGGEDSEGYAHYWGDDTAVAAGFKRCDSVQPGSTKSLRCGKPEGHSHQHQSLYVQGVNNGDVYTWDTPCGHVGPEGATCTTGHPHKGSHLDRGRLDTVQGSSSVSGYFEWPQDDLPDGWTETWCPDHGPDVSVDEDGLCNACGVTSVGKAAERAAKLEKAFEELLPIVKGVAKGHIW